MSAAALVIGLSVSGCDEDDGDDETTQESTDTTGDTTGDETTGDTGESTTETTTDSGGSDYGGAPAPDPDDVEEF